MNKLFKSIVCVATGLAMAIGVGVGVSKEAKAVYAADATYDFTEIDGFSSWGQSYAKHTVTYDEGAVVFESANRQTSTITDRPVTKGSPVSFVLSSNSNQITSATFTCLQWGTKAQTITLHYSTDGGSTYTSTGVTSTNFTITSSSLAAGTNAVKITFSSSSNQVGISSLSISYSASSSPTPTLSSISVATAPTKTDYEEGEFFDPTGLVISRTYSNSTIDTCEYSEHASEFSFEPDLSTALTTDDESVTITYGGKTASQAITVSPFSGTEYILCTSTDYLTAGAKYIFTSGTSGTVQAMATTDNANNRRATSVVVDGNTNRITSTKQTLELELGGESDLWTFETLNYLGTNGYLAPATGKNNQLRVIASGDTCTITFNNNAAVVTFSSNSDGRNLLRYNSSDSLFACYSGNQNPVYLWKEAVSPTGISLDKTELEIAINQEVELTATLAPSGAIGTIVWESSNSGVATVNNGTVKGIAAGEATITAKIDDNIKATCSVTVVDNIPATAVTLDKHSGTLVVGQTDTLTATLTPSNASDSLEWGSSNTNVATVANGLVTAVAEGDAVITASAGSATPDTYTLHVNKMTAANLYVGANVDIVGEVVAVNGQQAVIDDGTAGLWAYNSSGFSAEVGDVVKVQGTAIAYDGAIEVTGATLTPASGEITKVSAQAISEEQVANYVTAYVDGNTPTLPHNKVSLTTGIVSESGNFLIWSYGSSTMEAHISDAGIQAGSQYTIEGYLTKYYHKNSTTYVCIAITSKTLYEDPDAILDNYLSNASKIATIRGDADVDVQSVTNSITFADLNLDNGVQYPDPFDGTSFTITFDGGSDDGKYYTTGSGIRTYGGGTITIASKLEKNITQIKLTWSSSSNAPAGDDVVNVGTYNSSTGVWTGSASSVVFTRPSGSGHWRLQEIEVKCGSDIVTINSLDVRFGIKISADAWDAIVDNEEWTIEDYGVMMFLTSKAKYDAGTIQNVQDRYDSTKDLDHQTLVSVGRRESGTTPAPDGNGNYNFSVAVNVPNSSWYDYYFCARPFVKINGEIHWLLQEDIRESVRSLALPGHNNGTNFEENVLDYLAGN